MRESDCSHRSAGVFRPGQVGRRRLALKSVLAITIALLVGCAPRPAPEGQTPPLVIFFVDGVRLSDEAADSIWDGVDLGRDADSVRVLKDSDALAKYGARGRPGVVLIYLKQRGIADGVDVR